MKHADKCAMMICLLACLALTACGSDTSPSDDNTDTEVARASIGPTGGTVEGEGIALDVPENAVTDEVEISITLAEVTQPENWDGVSEVYRFEPAGLEFAQPADIEFSVEGDASEAKVLWSSDDGETWEALETTAAEGVVTAKVEHFSVGMVALPGSSNADAGGDADPVEDAWDDTPTEPADAGSWGGGVDDGGAVYPDTGTPMPDGGSSGQIDAGTSIDVGPAEDTGGASSDAGGATDA